MITADAKRSASSQTFREPDKLTVAVKTAVTRPGEGSIN
jgi:hypothetical protein